ncbi:MAG: archaellin/type IV pilin N-terminal domain-containing protein [Candidatus Aenigmatarchaeota archaeon]
MSNVSEAAVFSRKAKGVSPLVAAVLLISFTMAIAAILATWATQYMNQQTATLTQRGQEANCVYARLALDTFNYDRASGQLVFIINNNGKIGLENFTLYVYNATGIDKIPLATDSRVPNKQNSTLQAGEPRSYIINSLGGNLTRMKLTSQCADYGFIDTAL